tara:strand:+ start:10138 stop:10635 length:498 start_codon:yes stop_codon:yes gene_type:complete
MANSQELYQSLATLDGWKRICKPFLFIFGGPKKSFQKWNGCNPKGVYQNYRLARFEHDGTKYAIYAFSTQRQLSEAEVAGLSQAASQVPLGAVRYESLSYTGLEPWRGGAGSSDPDFNSIGQIGSVEHGVFVYPLADDLGCSLVVHGTSGGEHCIFPVPNKRLQG